MYNDLEVEILKMYRISISIIPVLVGTIGLMVKGSDRLIEVTFDPFQKEMQRIVFTNTAHTLRIVLFL